jgi:hypothetical protein
MSTPPCPGVPRPFKYSSRKSAAAAVFKVCANIDPFICIQGGTGIEMSRKAKMK